MSLKSLLGRPGEILSPGLLLAALWLAANPAVARDPWTAPLASGGRVEVDPRTNRPIYVKDGRQTQLWDGVHRLEDGSVIRIEQGRVVPTLEMLSPPPQTSETAEPTFQPAVDSQPEVTQEAQVPQPEAVAPASDMEPGPGNSPCDHLVWTVCGAFGPCWGTPPCNAARQLRALEREELLAAPSAQGPTGTSQQCIEAMGNHFFPPCQPGLPSAR